MFRSDALTLVNAFRTKEGRKALLGMVIAVFGLGMFALPLLGRVVNSQTVVKRIAAGDAGTLLALAALFVVVPAVIAVAIAVPNVQHELFKSSRAAFLLAAPVRTIDLVLKAYARSLFGCVFVMASLALPSTVYVVTNTDASPAMLVALPLAHFALAASIVGAVIFGQVLRARFVSGRFVRIAIQWTGIVAALALVLAMVAGLFAGRKGILQFGGAVGSNDILSTVLGGPVGWVAASMKGVWPFPAIWRTAAVAAGAIPCLLLAAWPLRRAFDRVVSAPPVGVGGAMLGRRRVWASTPGRALAQKDLVGMLQERSGLVFILFFIVMQLVVLKTKLYRVVPDEHGYVLTQHVRSMLMCMHGVLAIFTGIHCLGLAAGEQKQLPILATAPLSIASFVRGKLVVVLVLFVLSSLTVGIGAMPLAGAPLSAVAVFAPVALAVTLFASGVCLALGTLPSLLLVDPSMPLANSFHTIVPSLGATGGIVASMIGTQLVAKDIERAYKLPEQMSEAAWHGGIAIAIALACGIVMFVAGYAVAKRNVRVALRPCGG